MLLGDFSVNHNINSIILINIENLSIYHREDVYADGSIIYDIVKKLNSNSEIILTINYTIFPLENYIITYKS